MQMVIKVGSDSNEIGEYVPPSVYFPPVKYSCSFHSLNSVTKVNNAVKDIPRPNVKMSMIFIVRALNFLCAKSKTMFRKVKIKGTPKKKNNNRKITGLYIFNSLT